MSTSTLHRAALAAAAMSGFIGGAEIVPRDFFDSPPAPFFGSRGRRSGNNRRLSLFAHKKARRKIAYASKRINRIRAKR